MFKKEFTEDPEIEMTKVTEDTVKPRDPENSGKPYNCQFCDKVFYHSNGLKRHEKIHTDGSVVWK